MKKLALVFAVSLAAGSALADGSSPEHPFVVSYDMGALVALGGRPNLLDDAVLVGLTGAYEVVPSLAIVASVSRARTEVPGGERSVLQYDAGVRGQLAFGSAAETVVVPFLGGGFGGRTSDDREVGGELDSDLTAYVAAGARVEYGFGSAGVTARAYASSGHGPWFSHWRSVRGDLAVCASVGVRF